MDWNPELGGQWERLRALLPEKSAHFLESYVASIDTTPILECQMKATEVKGALHIMCKAELSDQALRTLLSGVLTAFNYFLSQRQITDAEKSGFLRTFHWNDRKGITFGKTIPSVPNIEIEKPREEPPSPEMFVRRKLAFLDVGGSRHQEELDQLITLGLAGVAMQPSFAGIE